MATIKEAMTTATTTETTTERMIMMMIEVAMGMIANGDLVVNRTILVAKSSLLYALLTQRNMATVKAETVASNINEFCILLCVLKYDNDHDNVAKECLIASME